MLPLVPAQVVGPAVVLMARVGAAGSDKVTDVGKEVVQFKRVIEKLE